MALKLILLAALAVASDASSILREAKDNVKKQMTDQNARRTQDVDACGCTFPFKTETTADDGSVTPFRYYGCMVTDTADYGWTVDTEPWCEYHYDTDADGANDVNGWGYCGAKGALEPEGDLDCVEGLDPDAKTSTEACSGCAELAALVGGEFTGACIDNFGDGFYCDTYWTLKDRLDRDIDAEPYYWMYCDAPTDEAPHAFTDDNMIAGYGCSVCVDVEGAIHDDLGTCSNWVGGYCEDDYLCTAERIADAADDCYDGGEVGGVSHNYPPIRHYSKDEIDLVRASCPLACKTCPEPEFGPLPDEAPAAAPAPAPEETEAPAAAPAPAPVADESDAATKRAAAAAAGLLGAAAAAFLL